MGIFRDKLIEEIEIRGFKESTKKAYLDSMEKLVRFSKKSPDRLGIPDIKKFQLYLLKDRKLSPRSINRHLAGISFFYHHVLGKNWPSTILPRMRTIQKLPVVFSKNEIKKMIESLHNIKYRAIIMTLYSTGMRVTELLNLRPTDIDSKRMVIHIRDGKGGKDRLALLSPILLQFLRKYWGVRKNKKSPWLFPPPDSGICPEKNDKKLSSSAIGHIVKIAGKAAGIKKRIHPHAFRHSFAVHLLEKGTNFRHIQYLLGHSAIQSTVRYTQVANINLIKVKSPLEDL